jgi:hypothetical protein
MLQPHFGLSVRVKPTFPKVGSWNLPGLLKTQSSIVGVKTSCIGVFLMLLEKVLKCRCPKWPRMSHLDICSPSYGQKKGRESNWQFDSWPLKVGNWHLPDVQWQNATCCWKLSRRATTLVQTLFQSDFVVGRYELPNSRDSNSRQFRDSSLGVPGKRAIWM